MSQGVSLSSWRPSNGGPGLACRRSEGQLLKAVAVPDPYLSPFIPPIGAEDRDSLLP